MRIAQDDLPSVTISPMRARGQVTRASTSVRVDVGGLERRVRVVHRDFPNGGSWSFFLCPYCGRRCRRLRLHEGRIHCPGCLRRALKMPYRVQQGDHDGVIERLRDKLSGRPLRVKPGAVRNRARLERSLRLAELRQRARAVKVKIKV